jgi:hypothetical protein
MFLLSSDSQWLSSLFLGSFMDLFRAEGLLVNTFDQGNVPDNEDWMCCSVGPWFEEKGAGFNYGCGVGAIKFIQSKKGKPVRWSEFEAFVLEKSGWLSSQLRKEVQLLWNGEGDAAWPIYWAKGLEAIGSDENGVIWKHSDEDDFRIRLLQKGGLLG